MFIIDIIFSLIDSIAFFVISIWDYVSMQFAFRDWTNWIFFFFPLVIFFEFPRYVVPTIAIPIIHFFGGLKEKRVAELEFIKKNPLVSVIVAGRNEGDIIASTIESLLNLSYGNIEIIVIDDASDDNMYEVCKTYADRGLIRLYRNSSSTGRAGRPVASNLGLRMSYGELIISVDADTTYDRDMVQYMIGPFYDPKVGAVAGNIKARNLGVSCWADFQAMEYAISIGLWKRWTTFIGCTMQASGAFGAFRREALLDFGGWDPELAEDADISLKIKKCGWTIVFAPYAIAMTTVPEKLKPLVSQRIRWDRGAVRTYFHKHANLFDFRRFQFRIFLELVQDYLAIYLFPFFYVIYLVFMIFYDWRLLIFAISVTYVLYVMLSFFTLFNAILLSERRDEEWFLLWYTPFFPIYKEIFRWVRLYANILETFRLDYEVSYIPHTGYKDSPKW